jgi:flagellar hook-associated protein 1 FlgK
VNSLTSGITAGLAGTGSDILAGLGLSSANSFNLSVTDAQGNVVTGGTPAAPLTATISLTPTLPATTFSLADLATAINSSAIGSTTLGVGNGVTATASTDANGKPILTITAANGAQRVVMGNNNGNVLGALGMNNLFTGTDAASIAVKSSIAANPSLLPTGQMRSDGGLSSLNAANITALSQLADTSIAFSAAGGLPGATVTGSGYANSIASNLAVQTSDAKSRSDFAGNVYTQLTQQMGSVSGVNLNEELSQMLIFQQGFQASAHIVSVVNDLMDTLFQVVNR